MKRSTAATTPAATAPPGEGEWPFGVMEEAIRAAAGRHGRGSTTRAPFPRMLRAHFAWFEHQHEEFGLTWEGWVEVLTACGFTGRGGSALTARAARAAYQREKTRRREAGVVPTAAEERAPGPGMVEAVQAAASAPRKLQRLSGGVE